MCKLWGEDAFTENNRICFFVLVFTIYASDLFFRISIEGHTNSERIHNLGTPLLCSIQLFIFISFTSHTVNMTQNMGVKRSLEANTAIDLFFCGLPQTCGYLSPFCQPQGNYRQPKVINLNTLSRWSCKIEACLAVKFMRYELGRK